MKGAEYDSDGARRARATRRFGDKHYNRGRRRLSEALAAAQRVYNSTRWKKLRTAFLNEFPLCAECLSRGRTVAAVLADHREPLALRLDLAYEWANLQSLCQACHNTKSVGERGQAERGLMTGAPPPRDPAAPPAPATLMLMERTRVEVTIPAGTPAVTVDRIRAHLQRWADQASQHLGFVPTVIVKVEPHAQAQPPA